MTSHLDSHGTTDNKPVVQTGNGIHHDEYKKCGIAHVHTCRKDDYCKDLHINE